MRPQLFSDQGQRLFLKVRDQVKQRVIRSGAVRMFEARQGFQAEPWEVMAVIDRMVELGELMEVAPGRLSGDRRVFAVVD